MRMAPEDSVRVNESSQEAAGLRQSGTQSVPEHAREVKERKQRQPETKARDGWKLSGRGNAGGGERMEAEKGGQQQATSTLMAVVPLGSSRRWITVVLNTVLKV